MENLMPTIVIATTLHFNRVPKSKMKKKEIKKGIVGMILNFNK